MKRPSSSGAQIIQYFENITVFSKHWETSKQWISMNGKQPLRNLKQRRRDLVDNVTETDRLRHVQVYVRLCRL